MTTQHPEVVEKILSAVGESAGLNRELLLDINQRPAPVHQTRCYAMFLMHHAGLRDRQIADVFGVKSPATIRLALRQVREQMAIGGFVAGVVGALAETCGIYLGPKCPACNRPSEQTEAAA